MSQAILSGIIVFGSIYAAYSYLSNQNITAARRAAKAAKVLEDLRTGTANINFILGAAPLVVSEKEKVAAVLPKTVLLEPKTVRVREGSRHGSSTRIVRGYSVGSGSYSSTTESREQLRTIDRGTLVVTNQRIVFMGQLKTISIDVNKIMGIDEYPDSVGIHRTDKPNVESFKISDDLMLTYNEDDKDKDVPLSFTGQILGWIINRAIDDHDARKGTAAA